ncbi:mannose-1-phosphate guanylyltransferase [Flavobacterium sp. LaA7.5]|nr:mannose-1-phosphate guanylyltransferase [Flavobacterium salilacus subsp. altitudinum]
MNNNYYAVIMAGGVGSRFWPVSTEEFPKQFHDMLGTGETLIQKTFNRLTRIIPHENIFILTNDKYNDQVLQQLPQIKQEQVVLEPAMRNTAPCILYASLKIKKLNPDAVMVVAPSDHWIENEDAFIDNLSRSFEYAEKENVLMTLGIQPTFPNTGYGYIEYNKSDTNAVKKVSHFREKPDYETAKAFLSSGNFLWNAGIFIWSIKSIISAFQKFQPAMYALFDGGYNNYNVEGERAFIDKNYVKSDNISIDYAVMESADNVYVIPATFGWNDLGTWGSLYDKLNKDENNNAVINAEVFMENTTNNIIRTDKGKTVVIDGLDNFIVVDRGDILLIYPKNKEQEIKKFISIVPSP